MAELLELRLKACREQLAHELTLQGNPPADVNSLEVPPRYVLQGSFISAAERELGERVMPTLLARHWERKGDCASVNFNAKTRRAAFVSYCHATYGDKRVVDWLLRYGDLDELAVTALNQEVLQVRARCQQEQAAYAAAQAGAGGAADSRPAAAARGGAERRSYPYPPPAPKQSGRDPCPNVAARAAASQRRNAARQENLQLRMLAVAEVPGECDVCGWDGARAACFWRHRYVCTWHQVTGHLLCVECDERRGREVRAPGHMPRDRRPPPHCDATRCQRQDLVGQCYTCNRYLCAGCRLDQDVVHCVVCTALSQRHGSVPCVACSPL